MKVSIHWQSILVSESATPILQSAKEKQVRDSQLIGHNHVWPIRVDRAPPLQQVVHSFRTPQKDGSLPESFGVYNIAVLFIPLMEDKPFLLGGKV
jgi:hypothetical protein